MFQFQYSTTFRICINIVKLKCQIIPIWELIHFTSFQEKGAYFTHFAYWFKITPFQTNISTLLVSPKKSKTSFLWVYWFWLVCKFLSIYSRANLRRPEKHFWVAKSYFNPGFSNFCSINYPKKKNKLTKLRRHPSRVHFAKIHFGYIHFGKLYF